MTPTRESVYVALWALFMANATIVSTFKTRSRLLRPFQQVPGGETSMPAFYLVQHPGETQGRTGKGMSPTRTLLCHVVMYFATTEGQGAVPATACNNGLDAIDDCLNINRNPSNNQTLGGLVQHVYIEGAIDVAEGLLQDISIVSVPITILLP